MKSLLLFGATGDLARRMLAPSLFGLDCDGLLPDDLRIVGAARSQLDDGAYQNLIEGALHEFIEPERLRPDCVRKFLARIRYVTLDVTRPEQFQALREALMRGDGGESPADGLRIFLSTAPSLFGPTIAGLVSAGLTGDETRLALEKPLGHDLASSRAINEAAATAFPENRTFRIDHYLGKETVQNLLALRFGNALFEPLWNAHGIDHVQITVAETVGVEGRLGFYDETGALRDMVQNHMLQLLALTAMEPPAHFDATSVRDEKVKVLRSLRPINHQTVMTHTVVGQYGPGAIGGATVAGYADELGRSSTTETFVALKAHVDNWRWRGTPFYLRTGKRLPTRTTEIFIQLKAVPHSIFTGPGAGLQPNKLIIRLQPQEAITLRVMLKEPGLDRAGMRLREAPLDISIPDAFADVRRRIAYERLLLDLLDGDSTLFVRRDEVEAQWTWIDAIRAGWRANAVTPRPYAAGTWGPSAAIGLTERDGVTWHD